MLFLNVDLTFPGDDFRTFYFPIINNYFIHECIEENNLLEISDKLIAEYSNENKMISKPFQIIISVRAEYYMEDEEEEEEKEKPITVIKSLRENKCVVCLSKEPKVLFYDCMHYCVCLECEEINPFDSCPYCRTRISTKII